MVGGQAAPDSAVPAGMVAFFSKTACPQGWVPAPKAQGRLLIAAVDPMHAGEQHGEALTRRDLPSHMHSYEGEFRYNQQNSADDLRNIHETVEPGTVVQVSGESRTAWLQIPVMQLPACRPVE